MWPTGDAGPDCHAGHLCAHRHHHRPCRFRPGNQPKRNHHTNLADGSPTANPTATIINDTSGPGQCHAFNDLPDPACTAGSIDQRVTQDNIRSTICVSGYTRTVRPPTSYTNPLKLRQMGQYGFAGSPTN